MTDNWQPGDPVPNVHDKVPEMLAEAGLSPDAVRALLEFDVAIFQWHRQIAKGEFTAALAAKLGEGIEAAQMQALTAIFRIRAGVGRAATDPTIGLVAEELSLDPSRASRIVSDLVGRGLVRREAAQEDGRKSVLSVTAKGKALIERFRAEKWAVLARVFKDWEPEALTHFARGVQSYTTALRAEMAAMSGRP